MPILVYRSLISFQIFFILQTEEILFSLKRNLIFQLHNNFARYLYEQ